MEGKRKKYDWLFIIGDFNLEKEFDRYYKQHQNISVKRAARAFVIHKRLDYKWPCYEKGNTEAREEYFKYLAKVDWIGS